MIEIGAIGQEIARHPDGSIDFDFYRDRAVAFRRNAIRDAAKLKPVRAVALMLAEPLAIAFLLAGPASVPLPHFAATADTVSVR
jgi:hypothetical protein